MGNDSTKLKGAPEVDLGNEAGARAMEGALQSSFTILKLVIAVLVVYLIFSNTFAVDQDSEGAIVLRFGQSRTIDAEEVYKAGIRFAWPYPIDEKVEIKRERPVKSVAAWHAPVGRVAIGDSSEKRKVDALHDGYAITKDDKIIYVKAEMIYRVSYPSSFAFDFASATKILQLILDNGLTYSASQLNLSEILENPTKFAEKTQLRAAKLVQGYDLGVEVVQVNVRGEDVKLPFYTQDAYDKINGVRAKIENELKKANSEYEAVQLAIGAKSQGTETSLGALSGEVATIRNQANNQADALRASVNSLANRFKDIIEKYPDPVSRRRYMEQMYYEAMERIADNEDIKVILVSKTGKASPTKLRLLINQPPPEVEEEEETEK